MEFKIYRNRLPQVVRALPWTGPGSAAAITCDCPNFREYMVDNEPRFSLGQGEVGGFSDWIVNTEGEWFRLTAGSFQQVYREYLPSHRHLDFRETAAAITCLDPPMVYEKETRNIHIPPTARPYQIREFLKQVDAWHAMKRKGVTT